MSRGAPDRRARGTGRKPATEALPTGQCQSNATTPGNFGEAEQIDYDGKRFHPVEDESADPSRVAVYHQDGDLLWGEFLGGKARRGALTGTVNGDGTLEFAYCMVNEDGDVISGHCASTPHRLDDGRIRLEEVWERFGAHESSGVSVIEELPTQIPVQTART